MSRTWVSLLTAALIIAAAPSATAAPEPAPAPPDAQAGICLLMPWLPWCK